jgi:hypothetical protein
MKHFIITILALILQCSVAFGQSVNSCLNLLPKDAKALIDDKYINWRILSKQDLLSDDQILWDKKHENECPGIAIGKYRNDKVADYAVLIIPKKGETKKANLLMLAKDSSGKYTLVLLYGDKNVANYPVIYKVAPGQYYYFYDSKKSIMTKHDVVIYEHIEASAIAFYYKNGNYEQLLTSD